MPTRKLNTVDALKRGIGTAAPATETGQAEADIPRCPDCGRYPIDHRNGKCIYPPGKPTEKWPARISMTASREMKRELEAARIDDGIEVTARLRAMISLWQSDPELRARVDELARGLR